MRIVIIKLNTHAQINPLVFRRRVAAGDMVRHLLEGIAGGIGGRLCIHLYGMYWGLRDHWVFLLTKEA